MKYVGPAASAPQDIETWDSEISALGGLASAADRLPYFTGAGTAAVATFTAVARTLVSRATIALMRTDLGMLTGAGTPASTPTAKGYQYFDTTNNELWVAIGTSSSADWRLVPRHKSSTTTASSSYTFVRADGDSTKRFTAANPTATLPTNASVPYPIGTRLAMYCSGTTLTVANTRLQGSPQRTVGTDDMMVAEKIATDTWLLVGGTS